MFVGNAWSGEIVFFTSAKSTIHEVSLEDVRNLYLGREKFVDSNRVQVVDFEQDQNAFLEKVVRKEKKTYTGLWRMMVFTGKSMAPKVFKSESDLFAYVAKHKNVVAYTMSEVKQENLKVLKVK